MLIKNILYSINVFSHFINLLRKSQKWNDEQLNESQFIKLKEEIEFAWNYIPFYRKYWEDNGFRPEYLKTLEDISKIPLTDKNTIREHLEEIVNPYYPKDRLSFEKTGGTTGMPMNFYIDKFYSRAKELAFGCWFSYHYWGYLNRIHKIAILRGFRVDEKNIKRNIFWQKSTRDNGLIFSSFHIVEENYETYLSKLRNFKPKYIKAYPSSIVALCTLMKRHKDFGIDGLKAVICSSETVYDSHRKLIKETLGVDIYSFYGHSEKSVCAYQKGDKMMFEPFYGYTEFLDPKTHLPSENGEIAQVIVTSLDNHYFPFIRYNTNDLVEVYSYKNRVASKIIGRSQEFLIDKLGNKIPFTCSDEIFWNIDGVIAYQYIQSNLGEIEINLQVDKSFREDSLKMIEAEAKNMFSNFNVLVTKVNNIDKTESGKFRYLIQNIK